MERDAKRGKALCAEALELVRGTKLDTGTFLDRLASAAATCRAMLTRTIHEYGI